MHVLNIIVSRTKTLFAKSIRFVLGGKYNHCSIALDNDFNKIYAFSRYYYHVIVSGCFNDRENINRYEDYIIYSIPISESEYNNIVEYLNKLSNKLHLYNFIGAIMMPIDVGFHLDDCYICSTFTAKILSMTNIIKLKKEVEKYNPMDVKELLDSYNNINKETKNEEYSRYSI